MKERPERQGFMYEPLPHELDQMITADMVEMVVRAFGHGGVIVERSNGEAIIYARNVGESVK